MNRLLSGLFFISILSLACHSTDKSDLPTSINLSPVIHLNDTPTVNPSWSKENTIVSHLTSEPDNLHPSNGGSSPRDEIFLHTQAYLLITDFEKQEIAPGLVTTMPVVSADGLHYTYTLRDDPRWDNGQSLSIEDILFTAKAQKCPLTNNPSVKNYWNNLRDIIVDSTQSRTFTMVMREPNIQNISFITSFCIMQRTFHDPGNTLKKYSFEQLDDTSFHPEKHADLVKWAQNFNDDKYGRDPEFLNGLGAYKVSNWDPGESVTLVKKKNHWTGNSSSPRDVAYPDRMIFKVNKDENSVQLEFKAQTIDVSTNLSTGSFISLASNPEVSANYHHVLSLTYNYTYLAFNEKPDGVKRKKLFTDKKVRRALAHLTPVENLMKLVYKEYSSDCQRMISNVSPLKTEFNSALKAIEPDLKKARQLLTEAGWKDSDGDGILDKIIEGVKVPLSAELTYMNTNPDWKDMASLIAESYTKAGLKVELRPVDLRVFVESGRSHDFDLLLGSWGGTPFPEDFTQLWHSKSWANNGSNYSGFGNEQSDALVDSIKTEMNPEKRKDLCRHFQEIVYEDQPFVFLYCSMRRNLVHKRFGNVSLFADRPGLLLNTFKLLSTTNE